MSIARYSLDPARAITWAIAGAAGAAGGWFSFGFGTQLGGLLMGVIAAINGAAISALLASAALEFLGRRKPS